MRICPLRCLVQRMGLAAACVGAAALSVSASAAAADNVVVTDRGPVRGIDTGTMRAFLGIPYAAAPIGDLRWQPPQPHARWQAPLDTTAFGDHCPQAPSLTAKPSLTEDCLFLNVFTPTRDGEDGPGIGGNHRRPVMVWIHGGGLTTGESDDYGPIDLVDEGVVVVTLNYRLGILGFFAHPALSAESPEHISGNYGLMDQQFALGWVQRNIDHFGGDPSNVTIFGQSAGGLSIHAHLASPRATGLFHKAIVQSGAYSLTQPSLAAAEGFGAFVAGQVGCTNAVCLRALPVTTILALQASAFPNGFVPVVDGNVLPVSVAAAFASGQFNQVPVIEGSNHDEWRFFVGATELATGTPLSAAGYIPAIAQTLGVSPAVATFLAGFYPLAAYPPPSTAPSVALGALGTDAVFACNARLVAGLLAQHVPTFQYEFNDPHAPLPLNISVSFPSGSYHGSEIQYFFDRAALGFPALSADQAALSHDMTRYWTHFAQTGTPQSRGLPAWPAFGPSDQFQSFETPTPVTRGGFALDHKCAVWTP
jgi:para-nitrobenzyl esterase